ncbi:hypothetical protein A5784_19795, partial [Mycobacterium sp. 852013-50091_SCH5140682]|uniref:DUF2207 domain-containing protein n=1 Tax=Mycobacterium sp. 852013-50091_SCH5140682 TaxID=1834109 RepID=UPI0007E95F01
MRRVIVWSLALALTVFGLLWPVFWPSGGGAARTDDPVIITDYAADLTVGADGRLTAVETITADFPPGRHGLFRYWDVANPNNPRLRQPPTVTSIRLNGAPAPYEMLDEDGGRFVVAKIGDPNRTLNDGTQVFEIRYTVDGVLDPGRVGADKRFAGSVGDPNSASAFYWNVLAPAWNNHISRFRVSVTLPAAVTGAQCSVGYGVGRACTDLTTSGDTVRLSAVNLDPRVPVTLRAGVDVPTPPQPTLPWPYTWDQVLGRSVAGVIWVAALSVALGLIAFGWWRRTAERPPSFPLQYAPPEGIGPVQAEYIRTEAIPKSALTATLFHLADRGLIELRQVNAEQWNIRGLASQSAWADVDPVAAAVGLALRISYKDAEFRARKTASSGEKLNKAKTNMAAAVRKWALDNDLMVKRPEELWLRGANAVALVLAVCGFLTWFGAGVTMWGLPFAVFFVVTVRSWRPGLGTRRTEAGRELWSRVGGFHRLLTTDSAGTRFDFAARKDLYTAYIPFAVAAGAAALWAKKYQDVTGTVAPQPDWYHASSSGGWAVTSGSGGMSFDSFDSALSSSIGAYTSAQSSSSSSSGGGFSGGGGGGARCRRRIPGPPGIFRPEDD